LQVIAYRFDVVFSSLHIREINGLDELINDQTMLQDKTAMIKTTVFFFICPHQSLIFEIFDELKE
jgi:hypothetical protein